jgi:hypothetical protein
LWSTYSEGQRRLVKRSPKKATKIVDEGKARGSQMLDDFEKKVEVNGKTYS